jgi:prolipoprotein diacylglyceryltransferase
MEFSLLAAAALALAAAWAGIRLEARLRPEIPHRRLWEVIVTSVVVGLVVGRLAAMVTGGLNPIARPADILVIRAGVHTGAASTAALITALVAVRRHPLPTLDGIAPATLAGLAVWHAGCLLRDACLGTPTGLPWGMALPGSPVARHPVELYAALLMAVGAAALLLRRHRPVSPGVVAGIALAWAAAARLVTEPIRPGIGAGPVWWYAAGAIVGVAAALLAATSPRSLRQP